MKKYAYAISFTTMIFMLFFPAAVSAATEDEESLISIDSFVINDMQDEKIEATLVTSSDMKIRFNYTVSVITGYFAGWKTVASGRGNTGEELDIKIDMSKINTYDSYRFKISLSYTVDGREYVTNSYSKVFDYTQESYSNDLSGRNIVIDMTAYTAKIEWKGYTDWSAESVLVIIDENGQNVVEEVVSKDKNYYEYYFDQDTQSITITLKQVTDGKLSQGITDTIDIVKTSDTTDFYLQFPDDNDQYDSVWSVDFFNGSDTEVFWQSDSGKDSIVLNDNGTFLIELSEDDSNLVVTYKDADDINWKYEFMTNIVAYAPTIKMLEQYDGSTSDASYITLVGSVDDYNSIVKINDEEVKVDENGIFSLTVNLKTGKNEITIEAVNNIGKTSKKLITIYKTGEDTIADKFVILKKYAPLIITAGVSVVLLVIFIVVTKKTGGKKNEKDSE